MDDSTERSTATTEERMAIEEKCREFANQRFDEHGPFDQRGAALWDFAAWLKEGAERCDGSFVCAAREHEEGCYAQGVPGVDPMDADTNGLGE